MLVPQRLATEGIRYDDTFHDLEFPGTFDHGAGKIVPLSLGAMVGFMILLALNLRTSATAVGPVLNDIAESVELSAVGAGVLTGSSQSRV